MKLFDSCVWAEILAESEAGKTYKQRLPAARQLLVPTLVLYEVSKWASRTMSSQKVDEVLVTLLTYQVVESTVAITVYAAELATKYKLHALDALIYTTALEHNAELVTCDAHFKDLPQVAYTAKSS